MARKNNKFYDNGMACQHEMPSILLDEKEGWRKVWCNQSAYVKGEDGKWYCAKHYREHKAERTHTTV